MAAEKKSDPFPLDGKVNRFEIPDGCKDVYLRLRYIGVDPSKSVLYDTDIIGVIVVNDVIVFSRAIRDEEAGGARVRPDIRYVPHEGDTVDLKRKIADGSARWIEVVLGLYHVNSWSGDGFRMRPPTDLSKVTVTGSIEYC